MCFLSSFITVYQNVNSANYTVLQLKLNYEQPISYHSLFSPSKNIVVGLQSWTWSFRHDSKATFVWILEWFLYIYSAKKTCFAFSCGLLSGIRVEVTMFTDDASVLVFPSSGKLCCGKHMKFVSIMQVWWQKSSSKDYDCSMQVLRNQWVTYWSKTLQKVIVNLNCWNEVR